MRECRISGKGKEEIDAVKQGAFKKMSQQQWGRLVPEKRRPNDKTRGRCRPRPILERIAVVEAFVVAACRVALESLENRFRSFTLRACPGNGQAIAP
jgi:hypothetical protein